MNEEFSTGAVRDKNVAGGKESEFPLRFDLISPVALERLARTYGEGAVKYGDHNWRAGMPFSVTLNHAIAHLVAYLRGDTGEDHLAHAVWGIFALIHFEETHPELNDIKIDDYKSSPTDCTTTVVGEHEILVPGPDEFSLVREQPKVDSARLSV